MNTYENLFIYINQFTLTIKFFQIIFNYEILFKGDDRYEI